MKFSIKLAVAAACTLAPAAAVAQSDIIATLLDKATEIYGGKGYSPTGWEHKGTLAQGESTTLRLPLSGGKTYQIVGVCDSACENMDILLTDSNGKQVDKDELEDDFPIVGAAASGNFSATITMAKCKGSCSYAVKAFTN